MVTVGLPMHCAHDRRLSYVAAEGGDGGDQALSAAGLVAEDECPRGDVSTSDTPPTWQIRR
ncbi:MAG: hypothetical protein DLM58_15590 [Pseudonocardiales bacterium]|nr:MAG: hypothetical protein DLM58_15590 [Pseudonocardiales bacterium]